MELNILAVGDVVSPAGVKYLRTMLRKLKQQYCVDFCVVNGENAAMVGLTPSHADEILDAGADVITLGNHTWNCLDIVPMIEDCPYLLRPANFPPQQPGRGWGVFETKAGPVAVVNLIGRCDMAFGPDNPFLLMEKLLPQLDTKLILVDFHAEATSEKLAMGYHLDGRVSAVWGTHTHVPTADCQILPQGTGYITDLGMTGPARSILGVMPEQSVAGFRGELTSRFKAAPGPCKLEGAVFTIDTATGRCVHAEGVRIHED